MQPQGWTPALLLLFAAWFSPATLAGEPAAESANDRAKSLFREQLNAPCQKLNCGLSYCFELIKDGQSRLVDANYCFRNRDAVRIHLKLNFDGYAYILLAQGSSGKKAILFPERNHPENNKLLHNQEYVIPQRGVLRFDNTPGTEILQVVASRRPIQAGNLFALAGSTSLMRASDDKSHRSFVVSQDIDKNLSVLIKLEHKLSSLDDSVPLPQTKPLSPAVQLQTEIPDSTAAPVKNEPDQYTSAPVPSK